MSPSLQKFSMQEDHPIVLERSPARICLSPIHEDKVISRQCRCRVREVVQSGSDPNVRDLVEGDSLSSGSERQGEAYDRKQVFTIEAASPIASDIDLPVPTPSISASVASLPALAPRFQVTPCIFPAPENRIRWYNHTYLSSERIGQLLMDCANSKLTKRCHSPGYVLMFKYSDPDMEGLFKVGYTNDIQKRMRGIQGECKMDPDVINDPQQRIVKHAFRAKQLVLHLLHNHRMRIKACPGCNKDHIELFAIDKALALQAVEKARQFMENRYGSALRPSRSFLSPDTANTRRRRSAPSSPRTQSPTPFPPTTPPRRTPASTPVSPNKAGRHTDKRPSSGEPRLSELVEMARELEEQEEVLVADYWKDIRCRTSQQPLPSCCFSPHDHVIKPICMHSQGSDVPRVFPCPPTPSCGLSHIVISIRMHLAKQPDVPGLLRSYLRRESRDSRTPREYNHLHDVLCNVTSTVAFAFAFFA